MHDSCRKPSFGKFLSEKESWSWDRERLEIGDYARQNKESNDPRLGTSSRRVVVRYL